jgi:PAS domain S-box-containing protein
LAGILGVVVGTLGIRLSSDLAWIRFFDNMHWTSGTAASAILGWLSLKRVAPANGKGVFWFTLGLSGYAVGQIFWDIQTIIAYANFPAPSDLFYLWLGPCIAVGLLQEIRDHTVVAQQKTIWLDALTLTVAMLTLILALYLPKRGETALLPLLILIAYPTTLFGAASLALTMIPALRQRPNSSLSLFLIGLIITGLSWMHWNFMALDGTAIDGAWFNISFSVAVLLIGYSLTRWNIDNNTDPNWDRWCEGVLRLFPLITVVMASLAVVFSHTLSDLPFIVQIAADIGSLIVVLLAMIRQGALLKERDALLLAQSALVASKRELAMERGQLKSLVYAIPDLVWIKDPNGIYLNCNPRFETFFGASEQQIVGKTDYDYVDRELADFFRQHDRIAMETDKPCSNEEWLTFAVGGYHGLFETIKTPVRDESGALIGVLGIARDITTRKRLAEELRLTGEELRNYKDHLEETVLRRTEDLRLARDAAETANKAKSVFLANMSHELRTPLNAILGFSNMMRHDKQLSDSQSEYLDIINRSG